MTYFIPEKWIMLLNGDNQNFKLNLTVSILETIYRYTYANREELDKIPQNAEFHQGLHCWLRYNLSETEINHLKILTCDMLHCIKQSGNNRFNKG